MLLHDFLYARTERSEFHGPKFYRIPTAGAGRNGFPRKWLIRKGNEMSLLRIRAMPRFLSPRIRRRTPRDDIPCACIIPNVQQNWKKKKFVSICTYIHEYTRAVCTRMCTCVWYHMWETAGGREAAHIMAIRCFKGYIGQGFAGSCT